MKERRFRLITKASLAVTAAVLPFAAACSDMQRSNYPSPTPQCHIEWELSPGKWQDVSHFRLINGFPRGNLEIYDNSDPKLHMVYYPETTRGRHALDAIPNAEIVIKPDGSVIFRAECP